MNTKPKIARFIIILSFLCLFSPGLYAQFDFNKNCQKAFSEMFWLRFSVAEDIIKNEKISNPENKITVFLEDYIDCLRILTGQKESDILQYKSKFSARINNVKQGQKDSPYYHYCLAEMYFHSALMKLNLGSNVSASFDILSSLNHIKNNIKKFPDFEENRKIHGILQLFLGSVPDNYSWLTKIAGLSGNIDAGLNELKRYCLYASTNEYKSFESALLMCLSLIDYSGNQEDAYNYMKSVKNLDINNPLLRYVYAFSAIKSGNTDEAILLLEGYKPGKDEYNLVFYDFLLGRSYLYNLDKRTIIKFSSFLNNYKGINYIPTAYHKLSWYYFLSGDKVSFNKCRLSALNEGHEFIESDKQAREELMQNSDYDSVLLKARVFFDGGYFEKAREVLHRHKYYADYKNINLSGEYFYRMARINHRLNNFNEAEKYYLIVLGMEDKLKHYFLPNSALQLGLIYEKTGHYAKAEEKFNKCLRLNNFQYSFGIEQKARTALSRIK